MIRRCNRTLLHCSPALFLLLAASLLCSCGDTLYAAFLVPENTRELMEVRSGVEVHLRLTPSSLLEDELYIVNKSKDTVYINPKEIFFALNGRNLKIPLVEDYDAAIMQFNSKATLACNDATFPYKCVDAITRRNNGFKGKGFSFFSIKPGQERKGYIFFDFPTPLKDSPSKDGLMQEFQRNYKTLRGAVNVELIIGNKVETVAFPIEIGLYDNIKKSPFDIQSLMQ
ncbi:MAG: hypothetical protein JW913_07475 [Chitinispirillaceae bacterium]|nr:hypothetical protein [Chitinispirillaceae bacterium]